MSSYWYFPFTEVAGCCKNIVIVWGSQSIPVPPQQINLRNNTHNIPFNNVRQLLTHSVIVFNVYVHVPEAYLTHFSYRCWYLNCSVERAVLYGGGGGPENLDFFGLKCHSLRSMPFQGQKSLDFHCPPLPIALVMDVARIKIITSRAILIAGTLIVIVAFWDNYVAFQ